VELVNVSSLVAGDSLTHALHLAPLLKTNGRLAN